jgi:UDP:flavonoid glycosyltransferase YjiC (YdhE family)
VARYLFLTWDGSGNQTPTLGIAQALRARGHNIAFAGYGSQRSHITAQGFHFSLLERSNAALAARAFTARGDPMAALTTGVWVTPAHLDDVPEIVAREAPDLLVIDCLLFGALAAAERHRLPTAVLVHSAPGLQVPPGGPFERFRLLGPLNALRSAVGLHPIATIWENWARFPTLCASLPILDPLAALAPPTFSYVGPIQEQVPASGWRAPWPGDDPRPLVLVSFSSALVWDQASRIERTLAGLAERAVRVIVTVRGVDATQWTIPPNACVVPFLPHAEVLSQTAATVTHAGHGTTTAALAYGVPLVCLPNTRSDQPALAAQVANLGAGIALSGDAAPPEAIGEAVMTILATPSFTVAARRLADAIATADAPGTAVTWLETCLDKAMPDTRG